MSDKDKLDYTDIGSRLREVRENADSKKISQETFGKQFGVSQGYVTKVEKGGKPSLEYIIGIATDYDVSLDWLLLGREPAKPQPDILVSTPTETVTVEVKQADTRLKEWVELFSQAPEEARPILLSTARAIINNYPNPSNAPSTSPNTGVDEQAAAKSDIA